jgi:hydroxypyruvate reductase
MTVLDAARDAATERGYETLVLSSRIRGEARDAALAHVAVAEEMVETGNPVEPPAVVLSGGETTVTVAGEGRGGPNQEFALAAALDLPAAAALAAVDTDGIDGNTDAAGALVDGDTVTDRGAARQALDANDANAYLADRTALLETGPTGTNVNDLRVLVVESPE